LKNNKLYKYINLLLRNLIGVFAICFIYIKLKDNFLIGFQKINNAEINYSLLVVAFLLLFVNWGLEAIKWQYAVRDIQKITVLKAFKLTITGITMGLLTPNRIGEIPARALLLNKKSFKEITLKTGVASFSQLLITLFLGAIGLFFTQHYFIETIDITVWSTFLLTGVLLLFLVYFKVNKLDFIFNKIKFLAEKEFFKALSDFSSVELLNMLFISLLRYIVFSVQFYLVLKAFDISLQSLNDVFLIPVCFMIASFIPTIIISEIGVRGSVALFVFGTVSDMDVNIILASITLWLINVALPALMGLINLKELKIIKEN